MRLSALDALNLYAAASSRVIENGEVCAVIAIETGPETFESVRAALAARIARVALLTERVAHPPGRMTYPHWIADPALPEAKIRERSAASWDEVTAEILLDSAERIVPEEATWRATVWCGISGIPEIEGIGTIVAIRLSHCAGDGRSLAASVRAVFGDDSALASSHGHGNPTPRLGWRHVIGELVGVPWNYVRALDIARRAGAAPTTTALAAEYVAALHSDGSHRAFLDVRVVPTAALKWGGSVTATAALAVADSLARYLADLGYSGVSPLLAEIPIVPTGTQARAPRFPSANSASTSILIDLGDLDSDDESRRERVLTSFAAGQEPAAVEYYLKRREVLERLPVQFIRPGRSEPGEPGELAQRPLCHISMTSVVQGEPNLALLGPVRFVAMLPILRRNRGLGVFLVGLGRRVAVAISASESVPRPELFADLMHAAIRRESVL